MTETDATPVPLGRRERNKQQKLERIIAAADDLFGAHGVDEVTTQQIADAADIGAGTLFLYAKNKAELLLLVQNKHYAEAIEAGSRASEAASGCLNAVMAMIEPVIVCNRRQTENGRTYLRELVFGDPEEPHHRAGLELIARLDDAVVDILVKTGELPRTDAGLLARAISAIMFVSLASPIHLRSTSEEISADIREQVGVLLRR